MKKTHASGIALTLLALAVAGTAQAAGNTALEDKLEQKIDTMSKELLELKAQLQELKAQNAALSAKQVEQQQQVRQTAENQTKLQTNVEQQLQTVQANAQAAASKPSALANLNLWGYGEIYYNRPTKQPEKTTADLARAVFGIGYQFDDKTRFNSEYEVEHGVTSSDDPGEFEVEQFYVDHKFSDKLSAQAGLFLIPAGLLNENHEPTNFYGVQRNFVETLIVPSTWREGGMSVKGNTDFGLDWSAGITTGLDLSKWNYTPEDPIYTSALEMINEGAGPMQAAHQELALANGRRLAQFLSLNYRGIPGLQVGGSVFTGTSTGDERTTLWEAHTRWTPGKFDISALYAHGSFSNTAKDNAQFPGTANPIPAAFYGYYGQVAYNAWQDGDQRLTPFVRAERYNMGSKYDGIAPGFGNQPAQPVPGGFWPQNHDTVYTLGANYYLTPNVVFKADYQKFMVNTDFNRIDLGLGLAF